MPSARYKKTSLRIAFFAIRVIYCMYPYHRRRQYKFPNEPILYSREGATIYLIFIARIGFYTIPYVLHCNLSTSSTLDCGNNTFLCALYILLDRECSPLVHCTSTMGLHIHNLKSAGGALRHYAGPNIHSYIRYCN